MKCPKCNGEIGYPCPKCGEQLHRVRGFNTEIFGKDDKENPFIGWICLNEACKGWYCEYCEEWHRYGTSCSVVMVRNFRSGMNYPTKDPDWKHSEKEIGEISNHLVCLKCGCVVAKERNQQ